MAPQGVQNSAYSPLQISTFLPVTYTMPKSVAAVIPAGGAGLRMGRDTPKQFLPLAGTPIIVHTIRAVMAAESVGPIILVLPKPHIQEGKAILSKYNLIDSVNIVSGGETRQDSVEQGLLAVPDGIAFTLVHDGVRPFITPKLIECCLKAARENGAAIVALPVKDTIKSVDSAHCITSTVDRQGLWQAQTPQIAPTKLLLKAHATARKNSFTGTDEASLLAQLDVPVSVVEGAEANIKITRPGDLAIAEAMLTEKHGMPKQSPAFRIGHGFDAHRLVEDRPLILGGVTIKHDQGLLGHSDADVLVHALCDAILGALGAGDLGRHFPDTDPAYKGVSSLKLLAHVVDLAAEQKMYVSNCDITVIAQRPKLAPHLDAMRQNLAHVCRTTQEAVNIKATTTEKMGFTGRKEGISAHAVALLARTA